MQDKKVSTPGRFGRRGLYAAIAGVAVLEVAYGCVGEENIEEFVNEHVGSTAEALASGATCGGTFNVDARKSLFVTEQSILTNFTFQRVMDTLTSRAGVTNSSLSVYQQWWDTQNKKPGVTTGGAHCDDVTNTAGQGTLNGFPFNQCPRSEGALASTNPFTGSDSYIPIGLVNRFDLAPVDGSHCGEYRIVFAKNSGTTGGRNLVIFEGVLPNPQGSGLAGCCPVAQFWAELSSDPSPASRATKLDNFFFNGLPGFAPVVRPEHYGMLGAGTYSNSRGQIRSNQFTSFPWTLKDFRLDKVCTTTTTGGVDVEETSTTTCKLLVRPETVKNNPFGRQFNDGNSVAFQDHFLTQVAGLQATNVNAITMDINNTFNAPDSPDAAVSNYSSQLGATFAGRISSQLVANGNPQGLTPANIANRAETQTCIGCHAPGMTSSLGGGLTWPSSLGFTHVEEFTEAGPDGSRFRISPALTNVFLPHRKQVLESFLLNPSLAGPSSAPEESLAGPIAVDDGVESVAAPTRVRTLGGSTTH
ncbi:hypothetical protein [Myxococcus sp. RHSTA-1-4]|uniref:hypothetical protein n=1 Tax=Myxococcus sp. RHSTA-1-4 TaxID=2874601 RepID=UPI001CC087CE|nr:hypothetical protein [Myxococcus sp. RHSTA-1-4]MBZ4420777.1 hypothetical protein [Myxococcus sp. RHSTA-1-4]